MKLTPLEIELLLTWVRLALTPYQHEQLKKTMPRAYAALMDARLIEDAANRNAEPVLMKRPSARRGRA